MKKRLENEDKERQINRRKKRGLSTIVITLIIILISLVAVGIVWIVVRNLIQRQSQEVDIGQFMLSAKIKDVSLNNNSNNVSLTVVRNAGEGQFVKLNFVFENKTSAEIITETISLKELEERRFTFHLTNISVGNLTSISLVPIINKEGKEALGTTLDKYTLSKTTTTPTGCTPATCASLGYECGSGYSNGTCSGTLDCGSCSTGYNCNATGKCEISTKQIIKNLGGVSWWRFESGKETQDEIGGRNLQINGTIWNSSGRYGGDYEFNGTGYIKTGFNGVNILDNFTISFWMKTTETRYTFPMGVRDSGTGIFYILIRAQIDLLNRLEFLVSNGTATTSARYDNSAWRNSSWHQLTFVKEGLTADRLNIYLDGNKATITRPFNGTLTSHSMTQDFYIGAANYGGSAVGLINASIDEVIIFNRSLTENEALSLYMLNLSKN